MPIHQPLSYVYVVHGESLLHIKRILLIIEQVWKPGCCIHRCVSTDVTFIRFSSVFKLESKEFWV